MISVSICLSLCPFQEKTLLSKKQVAEVCPGTSHTASVSLINTGDSNARKNVEIQALSWHVVRCGAKSCWKVP